MAVELNADPQIPRAARVVIVGGGCVGELLWRRRRTLEPGQMHDALGVGVDVDLILA